mgnify:CR=1 FL=1
MRSSLKNSVSCLSVSEPRVVSTAALTPRPPLPQAGEGEQGPHPSKSHTLSKKLHLAHKAVPFDMRSSLKNSVSCLSVSEPRVVNKCVSVFGVVNKCVSVFGVVNKCGEYICCLSLVRLLVLK